MRFLAHPRIVVSLFLGMAVCLTGCRDLQRETAGSSWRPIGAHSESAAVPFNSHILYSDQREPSDLHESRLRTLLRDAEARALDDRALTCSEVGIAALSFGYDGLAATALDHAISVYSSTIAADYRTEQVIQAGGSEAERIFKGEPYERSVCFIYRGLLYLASSDFGNARACFKNASGQIITESSEGARFVEWDTAQTLLSVIDEIWSGGRPDNLLIVTWGSPPVKILSGGQRHLRAFLDYKPSYTPVTDVVVKQSDGSELSPVATDDIYLKVQLQRERQMDMILSAKKKAADIERKRGKTGAALAETLMQDSSTFIFGLAAAVYARTRQNEMEKYDFRADVRQISNLPGYISVYPISDIAQMPAVHIRSANGEAATVELARQSTRSGGPCIWFVHIPY